MIIRNYQTIYFYALILILLTVAGCSSRPSEDLTHEPVDIIIRNGDIYDGSGNQPYKGDVAMPPLVQEGGLESWIGRLKDLSIREQKMMEMETPTDEWENLYLAS